MQGIYLITNLVNQKQYVGQSIDIKRRWGEHISLSKTQNRPSFLYSSMAKYGIENFKFEILELCSREDLLTREQYYYDKIKPVYNNTRPGEISAGGEGTGIPVLKICMETLKILEEYNSFYEAGQKNNLHGGEISKVCNGIKVSCNNFYWLKKEDWTPEWRPKKSQTGAKPIYQINIKTKEIVAGFKSISEASAITGVDMSSISKVCRYKKPTAGGFEWRYQ